MANTPSHARRTERKILCHISNHQLAWCFHFNFKSFNYARLRKHIACNTGIGAFRIILELFLKLFYIVFKVDKI